MNSDNDHIKWFRASSPYIKAHRGRTFVIYLPGEALDDANYTNLINDLALLYSLGVRLIVVHGAAPQIHAHLSRQAVDWPERAGTRVTPPAVLAEILGPIGRTRLEIEASLSMGHSPLQGLDIRVASGNVVKAKPLGIIDGVDYQNTGLTRRINAEAINDQLRANAIVLISPLGYSPSGETFLLDSEALAREVATAVFADKLIYLNEKSGILDNHGTVINEIQGQPPFDFEVDQAQMPLVRLCTSASQAGVKRCHVIGYQDDGALLEELFTINGAGTQIIRRSYEQLRVATAEDVAGIIELIKPLEDEGALVRRSRELIESEVEHFRIIERDGMIVACAALYPFGDKGELACLATHPDYRNDHRGELLLQTIESSARSQQMTVLFVLTTRAVHWFLDHGFSEAPIDVLPTERKRLYNLQRNSRYLQKALD
ncbi:MAG: amino-acid N-acetyltransferase [Proteobacteria bacterium]|jgi:amino-acid N-acetyltransferase|nr:amino-acid N-acetyltransferase [Pseudomonadota bacterium]MDA1299913.1 amino-acid N-acetyltransferase [Pseudomonadota bacterium]